MKILQQINLNHKSRRNHLKSNGYYENNFLSKKTSNFQIALPVKSNFIKLFKTTSDIKNAEYEWKKIKLWFDNAIPLQINKKKLSSTPLLIFKTKLQNENLFNELLGDLPHSFEKFQDLLLFPHSCLESPFWKNQSKYSLYNLYNQT